MMTPRRARTTTAQTWTRSTSPTSQKRKTTDVDEERLEICRILYIEKMWLWARRCYERLWTTRSLDDLYLVVCKVHTHLCTEMESVCVQLKQHFQEMTDSITNLHESCTTSQTQTKQLMSQLDTYQKRAEETLKKTEDVFHHLKRDSTRLVSLLQTCNRRVEEINENLHQTARHVRHVKEL
jgi:uncharacterized protein YukE